MRTRLLTVLLPVFLLLSSSTTSPSSFASTSPAAPTTVVADQTPAAPAAESPNFVFVLADDLDIEYPEQSWITHFPRLKTVLADRGIIFRNSFVSVALCCPSRASILRGQYAHNTKIFTNDPPGGGWGKARSLGLERSTFAIWLRAAGYKTILLGKYLNNYGGTYIPPGWDEWYVGQRGGITYSQQNYDLNENGRIVHYGSEPRDFLQDVIRAKAVDFIRRNAASASPKPFFLWMSSYSPHGPAAYPPRHAGLFQTERVPRTITFNEADVSGHPQWLQTNPRLTRKQENAADATHRNRLRSMMSLVETVDALIAVLEETGDLANTYIIFASDNGFHLGQHRLLRGKETEFEEDLRVPLIIRGPGVPEGRELQHFVLNSDLAPTFAQLAGLTPPAFVDGRSLVSLLGANPPPVTAWRQAILLEHGFQPGDREPSDLAPQAEDEPPDLLIKAAAAEMTPPPFVGIHTSQYKYIEYPTTGERELYDLNADPYEHTSIAATAPASLIALLHSWVEALRACAGAGCRTAENTPPP